MSSNNLISINPTNNGKIKVPYLALDFLKASNFETPKVKSFNFLNNHCNHKSNTPQNNRYKAFDL